MAIHLKTQPYCDNCEHFEADVVKIKLFGVVTTMIGCQHAQKCSEIYEHLQKEQKKNGKST